MARPTKPTTPEQLTAIFWSSIGIFVAMGCVGFWFSLRAPPEKAAAANQLFWLSVASWSFAALIYAGHRLVAFLFR
jgi:hypothetical protein